MQAGTPDGYVDKELDLRAFVTTLWAGRWLIGASTIICSVIAVVLALLAEPVFRAEALVQIRQDTKGGGLNALVGQFGGVGDFGGILGSTNGDRALALATLRSRAVIQAFIRDKDLLPRLFKTKWDPDNNRWNVSDPEKQPTLWHGYYTFTKKVLKVTEDKKTGLVTIAVDWEDPEVAAAWVTELIARTNAHLRDRVIVESEKNLEYLQRQIKQTGFVELQQSVYTLVESEMKKLMLAKGGEEYALKTVDPAEPPKQRIRPKRRQIAVIGFMLGIFFGVVGVFLKNAVRNLRDPV